MQQQYIKIDITKQKKPHQALRSFHTAPVPWKEDLSPLPSSHPRFGSWAMQHASAYLHWG